VPGVSSMCRWSANHRCKIIYFALFIRVGIEPCFYLSERIFKVFLFRCRSLTAAFLLLDPFYSRRTVVLLKANLSEPRSGVINALLQCV
jgi:hypothetical protein